MISPENTAPMESGIESTLQVPLALIPCVARALADAPAPPGLDPGPWLAVRQTAIHAQCLECAIPVTGGDLLALAAAETMPAKLDRLAHQYCARKSCESRYYRLTFQPSPGLDWQPIIESLPTADYSSAGPVRASLFASLSPALILRLAALFAVGALTLTLFRSWYYGLRIPILQPQHHYTTNPTPEDQ